MNQKPITTEKELNHNKCCEQHSHGELNTPVKKTKAPIRTYMVDHIDCANCAAKIEKKIQELPGVEYASLAFATKQLKVAAKNQDTLLPLMQKACDAIEPGVTLTPREDVKILNKDDEKAESRKDLIIIAGSAILLAAGILLRSRLPLIAMIFYIIAYLALGLEIILTAIRNLFKGNVFDENFLMSIATIGAFIIGEYPEAVGVMLFYRVGEWFEHRAVAKSRSQIMDALDLRPETVALIQGNEVKTIPAAEAKVGDIILVRPGDRIPLDGSIQKGESRLDTSSLTGEPVPVRVYPGSNVLSGCMNTSGVLELKVEKPLSESMVTRILNSVENAVASKPKIDRFITRFSRVYTPLVVLLAIATAIIPSLITGDWNTWVYTALTFLVISCPCALVLSVPLAFFSGIGAGSKQGILFKGGMALEALKDVKAIVMDKTGTITKGNFMVQKVIPADPDKISEKELLELAASCESASTHPIALSICEAAAAQDIIILKEGSISELPGHGIKLQTTSGSIVLCGNKKLLQIEGVDLSSYHSSQVGTEVLLAKDGIYIGCLNIADTIKDESASAIESLKKEGLMTAMLTGDTMESAKSVADQTGIDKVYAKLLPEDKLKIVKEIREEHGAVMFVGDGINDAPVLAGADVGAAMGNGADAAIEAADVVFMTSSMNAIPKSIRIAKSTGRIAKQNVIFALTVKVLVMILGLAGIASMWLAVIADTGVAVLCILNSVRILYKK